jgi:L-2-hydroxyglutarate oxidase
LINPAAVYIPVMNPSGCQVLIVGAGISGLTIARELVRRGVEDVLILEKESAPGTHASGRNSGVLHAGIYYSPDTLKARFCVRGNRLMKEFCREKKLALEETGKVIVATRPSELEGINELKRRADAAGARSFVLDAKELADIEPHAATLERALYTPDTAVIRPREILNALATDLQRSGKVQISYDTLLVRPEGERSVRTSEGTIRYEKLINAAGAYADRIARRLALGKEYKTLPFKGTYQKLRKDRAFLVRGSIYPVPDVDRPFLGVHLTRDIEGDVYAGPTAIPAFGRENYRFAEGWGLETFLILYREGVLFLRDQSFRRAAISESRKYFRRAFFEEAAKLVPELRPGDIQRTEKVGVRPQLIHWPTKRLVMDFVVIRDGNTLHILNAISPAFTSSMAFAEFVVSTLLDGIGEPDGAQIREA